MTVASAATAPSRRLRGRILRRQRPRVIAGALCFMGHQSCEALVPVAIGIAIDTAVGSGDPRLLVACLAGLALLFTVLTLCYRWFARLGEGAVIDESHLLRTEIAARVLAPGAALRRKHGELLTIASSDADRATHSIIWLAGLFGAGAAITVSSIVLLSINLILGAALITTAVLVGLALSALSPLISRRVLTQQGTLAGAAALATDLVSGLRVLHGLGAQRQATQRYRQVSREAEAAGIRAGTVNSLQLGASVLAATLVLAVSVAFAGVLALDGTISIGAFVAAVGVAQFIAEPMAAIGSFLQIGAGAQASAGRVADVLTAEPDDRADEAPAARRTPPDPIPLTPGEFVGIVADPTSHAAVLAALDVPGEPPHIEPHRPDLFAGSIADNLILGGATGDPAPALAAAGAREFVDAQPRGLDEHLLDRGLSLSGGQRQRLALARALHTDPATLVLIEPTTAVDSVTEEQIAAGIRTLRHGHPTTRTTVLLTTSPALLDVTDRVIHLADGATVTGTHRELLAHDAAYRKVVLG